jgi:hypothetical protein
MSEFIEILDTSSMSLADLKAYRYKEVDYKTGALISVGFTYDSKQFSLSLPAQANWHAIKDNTSEFTFPLTVSTMDNSGYDLAEANVIAFWQAGRDALKGHIDTGRALKKQIFDAADIAAVNAIVDNR